MSRNGPDINSNKISSRRGRQTIAPRFPFGKLSLWLAVLLIGTMVVYRISEAAGPTVEGACLAAIFVSVSAAVAGLIPIYKVWGKDLLWVVLGVFLSGGIRMLIGFLGVAIIIFFTAIHRTHFVGFLVLFYAAFMAIDAWLALWVLRNTKIEEDEGGKRVTHGNAWDIIGQRRRSA